MTRDHRLGAQRAEGFDVTAACPAARWLLGDIDGLHRCNRISVRLSDYADTDDLVEARQRTPSDRISFEDRGHSMAFGARRCATTDADVHTACSTGENGPARATNQWSGTAGPTGVRLER